MHNRSDLRCLILILITAKKRTLEEREEKKKRREKMATQKSGFLASRFHAPNFLSQFFRVRTLEGKAKKGLLVANRSLRPCSFGYVCYVAMQALILHRSCNAVTIRQTA